LTAEDKLPPIDWSACPLPSNRLTIGDLRQASGFSTDRMIRMLSRIDREEKSFVREAFIELRNPDVADASKVLKDIHAQELERRYVKTGLCGKHEAAEAIRELQTWAEAEARKHFPDRSR